MFRSVYDSLPNKLKLQNRKINLQTVNSESLKVDECADICFEKGGVKTKQAFYVVQTMYRKLILGRDWLQHNGVPIIF